MGQRFSDIAQVEKAITQDLGLDWHWITSNCYMFVDNENVLYANNSAGFIHAYGLVNPANPAVGIKVLRSLDFKDTLKKLGPGAHSTATNVTYDGNVIIGTNRSITILDRGFQGPQHTVEFGRDESDSNSIAVDEKNGINLRRQRHDHASWSGPAPSCRRTMPTAPGRRPTTSEASRRA